MKSSATTVKQYLSELTPDRRAVITAVRNAILKNLDRDYEEGMLYGMIAWFVPHRIYPAGYHCDPTKPLMMAGLASQANYVALHLMPLYYSAAECTGAAPGEYAKWFNQAWQATGKKLDVGKACVKFKSLDDIPLDVLGEAIRRVSAKQWIEITASALAARESGRTSKKKPAKPMKPGRKKKV